MAQAGLAWREDVLLTFGFLVYEDALGWVARSVTTSHFAEGTTAEDAVGNLTEVIDAALHAAAQFGISPTDWHDQQAQDDPRFVRMFVSLAAQGRAQPETRQLSGGTTIQASVARAAA